MPICLWMESSPGRGHATYIRVAVVAGHMDMCMVHVLVTNGHHQQVQVALAGARESWPPTRLSQPTGRRRRPTGVRRRRRLRSDPLVGESCMHTCRP